MTNPDMTRANPDYESAILDWRETMENAVRGENGWLKLAGLFWLREGENTVGSASDADIMLPRHSAPEQAGMITLRAGVVHFHGLKSLDFYIDELPISDALLRDDMDTTGGSRVTIGAIRFFIIRRGNRFAVRVIDHDHPALRGFTGRRWFPIDPTVRVEASYHPHAQGRILSVINSANQIVPMRNPGAVTFVLHGQRLRLEAFESITGELWFSFKDRTNRVSTYGAGRFLNAAPATNGRVELDFNRAYNPPCAFTPYAICPFAPRANRLPIRVEAGEQVAQ